MIRFKGHVDNESKVFLSDLLSHLQIFGIFLETWMEKEEEFEIEAASIQGFREWEDMCTNDEVDENFASSLSSYLKSC